MRSVRRDTRDAILVSMKRALEAVKATDDVSAARVIRFFDAERRRTHHSMNE